MSAPTSSFKSPFVFLAMSSVVMTLAFSGWMALLNNFTIEAANFTGREIGILQSLREVPGFLAFTAVFVLLVLKEQTFALVSLCLLTIGVTLTGLFPFELGLYATTVLMSTGFHYFETVNQSLSLQWFSKDEAPKQLGRLLSIKSIAALVVYGFIWLAFSVYSMQFSTAYLILGGLGFMITVWMWLVMPQFEQKVVQHKNLILRKRYWLYYLLTFLSGARRQIFVVFAGFMMVEKFGYSVADITLLYMVNHLLNIYLAPKIGEWIGHVGERKALTMEYIGLILVFSGYALVDNGYFAAALYVIDHVFFAMAIAIKTYFQKIADPKDIASTAGVSFTINHIAAVVIPALFGLIWLYNPSLVFFAGAGLAACSLIASQFVDKIGYQLQASVR
ncbi:MFS transporter [Thalassotalea sp. HSM 43]|uniref:MFS transporter n=1 Tax=Thalassotalea sp. HSM 43 TaxID=2552945 RepID=UPI0010802051|nr:MFS transporter [Thalassotalea sp. HSM 43]QBY05028.1 MFS transporter [Thalassotalea sp. HSM 43]